MPKTIIVCACPYCNQIKIIDPGDNTFINQAEAESFALERCSCNGSASARDKARTKNEAHKVLEDLTDNEKQFDFLSDCAKMILNGYITAVTVTIDYESKIVIKEGSKTPLIIKRSDTQTVSKSV